jgi:hypothetical protein
MLNVKSHRLTLPSPSIHFVASVLMVTKVRSVPPTRTIVLLIHQRLHHHVNTVVLVPTMLVGLRVSVLPVGLAQLVRLT